VAETENAFRLVISRGEIEKRISELAEEISRDLAGEEPVVIGVLTGAAFFLTDLVRRLTIPCRIDFIKASSYGSGTVSSGEVRFSKDLDLDIRGAKVLLVEDIVDTGLTVKKTLDFLSGKSPSTVRVCALIDKMERRREDIEIDYSGFAVETGFLVGYGLDWDEKYRNLPDIHAVEMRTGGGA